MNSLKDSLLEKPYRIFWSLLLNLAVYAALLACGARWKSVAISGFGAALALVGLWGGLKKRYLMSSGQVYSADEDSRGFWQGMLFGYVLYLAFTGGAVL